MCRLSPALIGVQNLPRGLVAATFNFSETSTLNPWTATTRNGNVEISALRLSAAIVTLDTAGKATSGITPAMVALNIVKEVVTKMGFPPLCVDHGLRGSEPEFHAPRLAPNLQTRRERTSVLWRDP